MQPLRPGDPSPDFSLANSYEVLVSLERLLASGNAVIEFVRGTWDPTTRSRLEEFARRRSELESLGARAVAVSCEPVDGARRFIASVTHPVSLLHDTEREVSRLFGVWRRFSFGAFDVARPASFVIDRCAFVRFARVSRSPIDVAPFEELREILEKLRDEREVRPSTRRATRRQE
jgi:peroxiredoxin